MRKPTSADAELLLHLYEIRRENELRVARKWFLTDFKPAGWTEIKARFLSHTDEDRWFRMTVSYWELVGTLLHHGTLHPGLFFEHTGEDIVTWDRCLPWIAEAREHVRPNYLFRFEQMVEAHKAFRVKSVAEFKRAPKGAAKPRRRSR